MNNSHHQNQNYRPVQRQSTGQRNQSGKPVKPRKNTRKASGFDPYLLVELMLLALSVTAALLFCSFLNIDYHFDYVDTPAPVSAPRLMSDEPIEKIYEREIPQKTEPPAPDILPDYDFSQPVPECDAYPVDYFGDTVFIGDSRTAGLILYTNLSPIDYSATGFSINNLKTKAYITHVDSEGKKSLVTCYEALQLDAGKYKSIYISTGVNELGWNASSFIKAYRSAIDAVREITDVPIYIQLILPVTEDYEKKSTNGITNEKQVQFNELLRGLAEEEELFLLDPLPLFSLEDGTLNPEDTYDGAHLQKFACRELLEFYQTHVVDAESYANTASADGQ